MTFGQIKTRVTDFLGRSDLAATIPTFIELAALELQRRFNFKMMESTVSHVFVVDEVELSLPTDYKSFLQAWVYDAAGVEKLYTMIFLKKAAFDRVILVSEPRTLVEGLPEYILDTEVKGGPMAITEWGGEFLIFPKVSDQGAGKVMKLDCYNLVQYSGLADGYTDELLTVGWDALLYGAVLKAKPYLTDDRQIEIWRGLYIEALAQLEVYSVGKDNISSTVLRMGS